GAARQCHAGDGKECRALDWEHGGAADCARRAGVDPWRIAEVDDGPLDRPAWTRFCCDDRSNSRPVQPSHSDKLSVEMPCHSARAAWCVVGMVPRVASFRKASSFQSHGYISLHAGLFWSLILEQDDELEPTHTLKGAPGCVVLPQ